MDAHSCGRLIGDGPSHKLCARFPVRVLVPLAAPFVKEYRPTPEAMRDRERRAGLGRRFVVPVTGLGAEPVTGAYWEAPAGGKERTVVEVGVALRLEDPVVLMLPLTGGPVVVRPGEALEVRVTSATTESFASVWWLVSQAEVKRVPR